MQISDVIYYAELTLINFMFICVTNGQVKHDKKDPSLIAKQRTRELRGTVGLCICLDIIIICPGSYRIEGIFQGDKLSGFSQILHVPRNLYPRKLKY